MTFSYDGDLDKEPPHRQSYLCASYVHYCRNRVQRPIDTGAATDKGQAHGLSLQVTSMSWPSNFAAQAPNVVAHP